MAAFRLPLSRVPRVSLLRRGKNSFRLGSFVLLLAAFTAPRPAVGQDAAEKPAPVPAPAAKAPVAPPPAYASDPNFIDAMKRAKQLIAHHQAIYAVDEYKKANKIAGGNCFECEKGIYDVQLAIGNYKDAAATAASVEATGSGPYLKSIAGYWRAQALSLKAGDKPKPAQLQEVHAVLEGALQQYPRNAAALFLDGKIMTELGDLPAARADFTQCVSCVNPNDPAKLRAEHFAEDPELSLHKMAPSFEVTALDGSKFNLDAMGGRVVLIDFWATWCGPCNRELPHMRKIAKEFAGQPLVILSVSWDSDETKWKDFIVKNEMTWMQYRDADHKLSDRFGINAIPHYFTIDADGVLTAEMLGEDSDVEGKLKKLLAKARAVKPAAAEAAGR